MKTKKRAENPRTKKDAAVSVGSGRMVSSPGAKMIARERVRQVVKEGWTPAHDDDEHRGMELTLAAISYAHAAASPDEWAAEHGQLPASTHEWPWEDDAWKPSPDPVRNLVKAGALIAAEIDRLLRKARWSRRANNRHEQRAPSAQQ